MNSFIPLSVVILLFQIWSVYSHSMMTCSSKNGNQCVGGVRNSALSLVTTNYRFDGSNPCQPEARGVGNLASKYSPQCPNCGPMGTVQAGTKFTVEWKARNHAVAVQNPGVVKVFMAGPIQNGQTNDFTVSQFMSNKICEGPFINCGKGANVDTTGDDVSCTLDCQMPNVGAGTYSIWWYWDWTINDGNIYATCSDIAVTGGNGMLTQVTQPPLTSSQRTSQAPQTSQAQQTSQTLPRTSQTSQTQQRTSETSQVPQTTQTLQRTSRTSQTLQRTSQTQTSQRTSQTVQNSRTTKEEEQTHMQTNLYTSETSQSVPENTQQGVACSDSSPCIVACGEGNVELCNCINNQIVVQCVTDTSIAKIVTPLLFIVVPLLVLFVL